MQGREAPRPEADDNGGATASRGHRTGLALHPPTPGEEANKEWTVFQACPGTPYRPHKNRPSSMMAGIPASDKDGVFYTDRTRRNAAADRHDGRGSRRPGVHAGRGSATGGQIASGSFRRPGIRPGAPGKTRNSAREDERRGEAVGVPARTWAWDGSGHQHRQGPHRPALTAGTSPCPRQICDHWPGPDRPGLTRDPGRGPQRDRQPIGDQEPPRPLRFTASSERNAGWRPSGGSRPSPGRRGTDPRSSADS